MPVNYSELPGSPVETAEETARASAFTAQRRLMCAWSSARDLQAEIMGGITAGEFIRPQEYPFRAGIYARRCTIEPYLNELMVNEEGDQNAAYRYALLTVDYAPRTWTLNGEGQVIAEETISPASIARPHDPPLFFDQKTGDTTPRKRVGTADFDLAGEPLFTLEWVYKRFNLADPLPASAITLINCVNDADITSTTLGWTFPKGTLLYRPGELARQTTTAGANAWTISYVFTFNPAGWNKRRRSDGAWATVYDGDGTEWKGHPEADFTTLVG